MVYLKLRQRRIPIETKILFKTYLPVELSLAIEEDIKLSIIAQIIFPSLLISDSRNFF